MAKIVELWKGYIPIVIDIKILSILMLWSIFLARELFRNEGREAFYEAGNQVPLSLRDKIYYKDCLGGKEFIKDFVIVSSPEFVF